MAGIDDNVENECKKEELTSTQTKSKTIQSKTIQSTYETCTDTLELEKQRLENKTFFDKIHHRNASEMSNNHLSSTTVQDNINVNLTLDMTQTKETFDSQRTTTSDLYKSGNKNDMR
eukprot:106712_1